MYSVLAHMPMHTNFQSSSCSDAVLTWCAKPRMVGQMLSKLAAKHNNTSLINSKCNSKNGTGYVVCLCIIIYVTWTVYIANHATSLQLDIAHVGMECSKIHQTRWEWHHNTFMPSLPFVLFCQLRCYLCASNAPSGWKMPIAPNRWLYNGTRVASTCCTNKVRNGPGNVGQGHFAASQGTSHVNGMS